MKNPSQRTFGSFSNKKKKSAEFDLRTANRMLPLVKQIAGDASESNRKLKILEKELVQLDSFRKELSWESRQRRYRIQEELSACEGEIHNVAQELQELGVSILEGKDGRVSFPTHINDRPAVFTWQAPEEQVMFWNYSGEEIRRPVPMDWLESVSNSSK